MKIKTLFAAVFMLMSFGVFNANAQEDKNMFNHVSLGFSTGTDGLFGFHAAAPIGDYVQTRMGISFMPKFKYDTDVTYTYNKDNKDHKGSTNLEGKLNMTDFNWLFDFYVSKSSSFHFTAGFYVGKSHLIDAYSTEPVDGLDPTDYAVLGLKIGENNTDKFATTDMNGYVDGFVKVNSFKPYLGIGFGRAVTKKRVSVLFDMGVQFWGSPSVYVHSYNDPNTFLPSETPTQEIKITSDDFGEDDAKILDTISKIKVFPVLSLKIFGRIL